MTGTRRHGGEHLPPIAATSYVIHTCRQGARCAGLLFSGLPLSEGRLHQSGVGTAGRREHHPFSSFSPIPLPQARTRRECRFSSPGRPMHASAVDAVAVT